MPNVKLHENRPNNSQHCWANDLIDLLIDCHVRLHLLNISPVSNLAQQHTTTCYRVSKQMQHGTSNNVWSFWPAMLRQFAWGLMVFLLWSLFIYNLWRTLDDLYLVSLAYN